MSTAISIFIIVLVLINVIGCVWMLLWTGKKRPDDPSADSTTHTWDGDLQEYNNPLPRWWLNSFYLTVVFSVVYLILYPGFGSFPGILGWTQVGQYEEETATAEARYGEVFGAFANVPYEQMAKDSAAVELGANQFANNCATCHGSDARGAKGFPNLTDGEWLYGGDPQAIEFSIAYGRNGVMPALGAALGEKGVNDVIGYLRSLTGRNIDSSRAESGKEKFAMLCASCHGADAKGNQALGAPNLVDDIWLHGAGDPDMRDVINNGRVNQMPAHKDLLSEDRIRVLVAYVLSLNEGGD